MANSEFSQMINSEFSQEEMNFFKTYGEKNGAISLVSTTIANEEKRLNYLDEVAIKKIKLELVSVEEEYNKKLSRLHDALESVICSSASGKKFIEEKKKLLSIKEKEFEDFKNSFTEDEWNTLIEKRNNFINKNK